MFADVLTIQEAAELLGLDFRGYGRRQPHPKSVRPRDLNAFPCARPRPFAAMAIVPLWRRAVETDLQGDAFRWQRPQCFEPFPREQHSICEHCRLRSGSARSQDIANVREQKRFTTSDENLGDAKLAYLSCDPPHTLKSKWPPRCCG